MKATIWIAALCALTLCGCAPFAPDSSHAGACNEMNSRMIFSGSTSNIRQSEIQTSQEPLLQRSYDKHCT